MSGIYTKPIGGNGGYKKFPMTIIQEIGMRSGLYVDQIRINDQAYGDTGGTDRGSIILADDEYINRVEYRAANFVDQVNFYTNKGRVQGGGGSGGTAGCLNNIRVLAIGGEYVKYVEKLQIMYIDKYQPSVCEATNVGFILAYSPPFEQFEEYTGSLEKTTESYSKVIESMIGKHFDPSVEGEFIVKASVSYGSEMKNTTLETFNRELIAKLEHQDKITQTIPGGYVGVKLVNATLMNGANGGFWMFPTSVTSYSVIKITEVNNLLGHYDLTGELHTQMPDLKKYKTIQNGYVYYAETPQN